MPPDALSERAWWVERFAVEGLRWLGECRRQEVSDTAWPNEMVFGSASLDELEAAGVTVRRVG